MSALGSRQGRVKVDRPEQPSSVLIFGAADIRWADAIFAARDNPAHAAPRPTRPTLAAILGNPATAWVIGGPTALVTFGNRKSNAPEVGGIKPHAAGDSEIGRASCRERVY